MNNKIAVIITSRVFDYSDLYPRARSRAAETDPRGCGGVLFLEASTIFLQSAWELLAGKASV